MTILFQLKRNRLKSQTQNRFFLFQQLNRVTRGRAFFNCATIRGLLSMREDCFDFKASGVFGSQKFSMAKNTLAPCSRWSHGEMQIQLK